MDDMMNPPQAGGRSAAMKSLLAALGDEVSGFLITPPGHDAPVGMINITPLPGDFDVHGAFTPPPSDAIVPGAPRGEAVVEVDHEAPVDAGDDDDDVEPDEDVDDYGDDDDDDDA